LLINLPSFNDVINMDIDKYNIYLKIQEPIEFYDICTIYQPSFIEIFKYGIDKFEKLLLPYYITLDNIYEEITDEQKEGLTNFDLVCNYQEFMSYLLLSLDFFCKSKLDFDEKGISFESFDGRLNRDNFDEFAEIILKISGRERAKKEKKKVFANDRQKDIWEKLQAGRMRNAKKNELKMEDVINVCEYGGISYIPVEEIKKWSLWRIINCYKAIMGINNYKDSFSIFLISGKNEIIDGKHWSEVIKLDYKQPKEY